MRIWYSLERKESMKHAHDKQGVIKTLADDLLKRLPEFKDLRDSKARIFYVWRAKPRVDDGQIVAARVSKLSSRWRDILGKDVEIEVCEGIWSKLTIHWRQRLIAHELNHVRVYRQEDNPEAFEVDNDGRLVIEIVPHDLVVRTFAAEVERYGFLVHELPMAATIAKAYHRYKKGELKAEELPDILKPEDDEGSTAESPAAFYLGAYRRRRYF
jgi:hypothetical protein